MAKRGPKPNPTVLIRVPKVAANYLEQQRQQRGRKTVGDALLEILIGITPEFPWEGPPTPRFLNLKWRKNSHRPSTEK